MENRGISGSRRLVGILNFASVLSLSLFSLPPFAHLLVHDSSFNAMCSLFVMYCLRDGETGGRREDLFIVTAWREHIDDTPLGLVRRGLTDLTGWRGVLRVGVSLMSLPFVCADPSSDFRTTSDKEEGRTYCKSEDLGRRSTCRPSRERRKSRNALWASCRRALVQPGRREPCREPVSSSLSAEELKEKRAEGRTDCS